MWIIHIILKCFCWEEKTFLGTKETEYIDKWRDCHRKIKLLSYILQIIVAIMFMETDKHLFECLITWHPQKNTSEIRLEFLVFFTFMNYVYVNKVRYMLQCLIVRLRKNTSWNLDFFIKIFMNRLFMYVAKTVCQVFLSTFLKLVTTLQIFCLNQCQMQIVGSSQHYWWELTHWHMNLEWWQLLSYM